MAGDFAVGHLADPQYLAAVGTGSTIFSLLFMGLNFLRMFNYEIRSEEGRILASRIRRLRPAKH